MFHKLADREVDRVSVAVHFVAEIHESVFHAILQNLALALSEPEFCRREACRFGLLLWGVALLLRSRALLRLSG